MTTRSCLLAGAGAALLATGAARAEFLGLFVEHDLYALDEVTLLSELGITDVTVWNVYAAFDHPADRAVGVNGVPQSPFNVYSCSGTGFVNSPLGDDRPPSAAEAEAIPAVNADSFFTIGNRLLDVPLPDTVIVAPGTQGPNADPWGGGNENMAWVLPPTKGGQPNPQAVAGNWPDKRVLLMRLAVPFGADVAGRFGLLMFKAGAPQGQAVTVSFFAQSGSDFGACCVSSDECLGCQTPETCMQWGGEFLGFGTVCPTQQVETEVSESGGGVFTHVIQVPVDCSEAGAGTGPCEPGPLVDPWISPEHGLMCQNFGVAGSPAIPAGFFAPGSDAFEGAICLRGVPIGPISIDGHDGIDFGPADTLIRRSGDPFDACDLPASYPTPPEQVELVVEALRLESVEPLVVTHDGGEDPELWNVTVKLSEVYTDEDPGNDPPPGLLTAVKTHPNGGTYTSVLYVQARFVFRNVHHPTQFRVLDTGVEGIEPVMLDASQTALPWVHRVNAGMTLPSPFCSDFHPAIAGSDPQISDCNGNGRRDDCDVSDGTSADCNGNGVPDECEDDLACTCPGDFDESGEVDLHDLVFLVGQWGGCPPECPADLNGDLVVDVDDLIELVARWGGCE